MPAFTHLLRRVFLPRAASPDAYGRYEPLPAEFELFISPSRAGDPRRLKLELELLRYLP
jgi:hypothetical protein